MIGSLVPRAGFGRMAAAAVVLGALAAVVWLIVLLGTVPGEADARSRYKVVKRTFSNSSAITIRDGAPGSPYPSGISVRGLTRGKILDANVTLRGYSHSWPADVDVMLVHGASNATIMSDVGGSNGVSNISLLLDDEAGGSLPEESRLVSGAYKPTNVTVSGVSDPFPGAPAQSGLVALSTFDRMNPNGSWGLYVVDEGGGASGQFAAGWSVQIKARVRR